MGGGVGAEAEEDLFLKEDEPVLVDLLAAAMALAICLRSPVNCCKEQERGYIKIHVYMYIYEIYIVI